ncbi:transmembrane protein 150C isoform X5 [Narcine bancroftii]|uniref:transmembrane protein 150C isoform X5 n=1 Tax=Narcine bancroftii TaxID=1343680 RepID=UPI0038312083
MATTDSKGDQKLRNKLSSLIPASMKQLNIPRYAIALQNKKICRLNLLEWKQKCYLRPPLLSIAGDTPPESSIFSQVLNMTAFLAIFTLSFIIYFLLMAQRSYLPSARVQWVSITSLLLYVGSFAIDFQNYDFEVHSKEKQENPSGNVSSVIAEYHSEHL